MKRFLTVLIASMFLASAAYAQDKKAEEKKGAAATEGKGETKDTKKAAKKEKTAKTEKAGKEDKATTTEKSEKMKDKKDK
jgi:Ni/Co efflux regulator RcnB